MGYTEAVRLRSRVRELTALLGAVTAMKNTAAYTAGDLPALLRLCRENAFLAEIRPQADPVSAWCALSGHFFTCRSDAALAKEFILDYGKTDLDGLLRYLSLYELRIGSALETAKQNAAAKSRMYTAFGLFGGICAACLLC